jgi:hypothetical protein
MRSGDCDALEILTLRTERCAYATHSIDVTGGGRATSLARRLRFCAIAASVNSNCAPLGPRRSNRLNRGLGAERAGALVQRIIELETYRTLALLGLPEAQRLFPSISRIEQRLAEVTEEMRRTAELVDNHRLLDELIALAAEPAPPRVCFVSAPAAPTTRSCSSACKPSASAKSAAFLHGLRFWRGRRVNPLAIIISYRPGF